MKPNEEAIQASETSGKRNVCNCFQITVDDMDRILTETGGADFSTLRKHYQVGSRCTSCEYEIKDLITVFREEQQQTQLKVGQRRVPFGRRVGTRYRQVKLGLLQRLQKRRFGIFVIRGDDFESSLVLSNLAFPEDRENANGQLVTFVATLCGADGKVLGETGKLEVPSDRSREYWLHELFPHVKGNIVGMLFIDYQHMRQVGSLRPYCCFNYDRRPAGYAGRWHYHDKYRGDRDYNGYYHCNHPVVQGQQCWMAVSNCADRAYESVANLRLGDGTVTQRPVKIPPFGSLWVNVADFFALDAESAARSTNSLLWLESNQALMVWFFWRKIDDDLWLVQHH